VLHEPKITRGSAGKERKKGKTSDMYRGTQGEEYVKYATLNTREVVHLSHLSWP
jgi:hypothetical protein